MRVATEQGRTRTRTGEQCDEFTECQPALRAALEGERAFRVEQLAELHPEPAAGGSPRGEAGSASGEVDAVILAGARQALADIERALLAMRRGRYGRCEDCGGPVPRAVLRAVPQAKLCLDCHLARGETESAPARGGSRPDPEPRDEPGEEPVARPPLPRSATRETAGCHGASWQVDGVDENEPAAGSPRSMWVTRLLGRALHGVGHSHLGHVRDVVAHRLPEPAGTIVTGLIADVGGHRAFVPAAAVRDWHGSGVAISALPGRRACCPRSGEILLARDVLGRPVMTGDVRRALRVRDIALRRTAAGWVIRAVDTRNIVQRLLGTSRRLVDWDALVGRRVVAAPQGCGAVAADDERRANRDAEVAALGIPEHR